MRWLMLWPLLLTVSFGFAALALYIESSVRSDLIATVDDELERAQLNVLSGGGNRFPSNDRGASTDLDTANRPLHLVIDADGDSREPVPGRESVQISDEKLRSFQGQTGYRTSDDPERMRVLLTPGSYGDTLVTALPLSSVDRSLTVLRRNLILGGAAIFAIVCLVVWLITTIVTRPVARMAEAASEIAAGSLDRELAKPSGSRETVNLANDLNNMLDQLRLTLAAREQVADQATKNRDDMRRFLADASHELRTPLTAISGYSDLYSHGMLDDSEDVARALGRIGSESQRLTKLVNDMLQISRNQPLDQQCLENTDVTELVNTVVDDLCVTYPERVIKVTSTEDCYVVGLRDQLHQAVLNIVANACSHTPENTEIDVIVEHELDRVKIAVVDHGPGISATQQTQIFKPFYRGDTSRDRSRHNDGAGLGLAVVKEIVERHDGRIEVSDTEGGGLTMTVFLPSPSKPHRSI